MSYDYKGNALAAVRGEETESSNAQPDHALDHDYLSNAIKQSIRSTLQYLAFASPPFPGGFISNSSDGESVIWEAHSSSQRRDYYDDGWMGSGLDVSTVTTDHLGFDATGNLAKWTTWYNVGNWPPKGRDRYQVRDPQELSMEEAVGVLKGLLKLRQRISA